MMKLQCNNEMEAKYHTSSLYLVLLLQFSNAKIVVIVEVNAESVVEE